MEIYECEEAVQDALKQPRPRRIVNIINEVGSTFVEALACHLAKEQSKQADTSSSTTSARKNSIDFVCLDCREDGPEGRARAFFSAPPPTVVFCANRLHSAKEVEETMVHELIHAYDFTVRSMDITKSDLLACSEIRSARESECYRMARLLANAIPDVAFFQKSATWLNRQCVRDHAIRSTRSMFPDKAKDEVDKMFNQCYADQSPFTQ
ncbi:hypothetical protein Poli38472_013785 [Pythium oligandrum]|uniref:Mitochondrial inner membrane protease ATP23 n=1 Tax=Pythium oligandrum TaxID=41045 RepID=A0A8K1C242_PYTOL|nr:hypothetical protein Poli38472_013785 [Pythium oligandrum]|eukprot:TMW55023.1 hypothetical protein Poli38472_013785 [Pythium oligandrum]